MVSINFVWLSHCLYMSGRTRDEYLKKSPEDFYFSKNRFFVRKDLVDNFPLGFYSFPFTTNTLFPNENGIIKDHSSAHPAQVPDLWKIADRSSLNARCFQAVEFGFSYIFTLFLYKQKLI